MGKKQQNHGKERNKCGHPNHHPPRVIVRERSVYEAAAMYLKQSKPEWHKHICPNCGLIAYTNPVNKIV